MTIIGSASIQIRADDKYFEPDVRRAVKKIKNLEIELRIDGDISKASKKIRDLRYRITSKDAVLKIDADVTKAEEKLAKLLEKFIDKDLNFNVVANTKGAHTQLSELKDRFSATRVPYTAQANTAAANAALAFTARRRTARIDAKIDPEINRALGGLFNTLTGTLPFDKIKGAILGVTAEFESMATKSTAVVGALGAVSAAVLTAGANIFAIASDLTQLGGVLALLPAGLFALRTILLANKFAWEGFGTAAADNSAKANEALAKLPPEAQKAALALRGVKDEIQKPVQKAFWEAVGTSLQDMVKTQLPSIIKGMTDIGAAWGRFTKATFDAVANLGDFNDVFKNVATMVDRLAPAMKPALEGLMAFVGVGSNFLPRFGTYLTEIATQFGNWATNAAESGKMMEWMENGIRRAQELGSIIKSTSQTFAGLARAAQISGASGLTDLANGMKNIATIVNGEPFQSRLVAILEGARSGAEQLGEGFRRLTTYIGESADAVGIFLGKAGQLGGSFFDGIKALFDGTGLGNGLYTALSGLDTALEQLKPGFGDLGDSIGTLGRIAGELFVNMAPGLNQLFGTLNSVLSELEGGITAAMPVFNEFMQNMLALINGPIVALAGAIGNILEGFAALPGPIQTVIASIGLFLLLKNRFSGFFNGLTESLGNARTAITRGLGDIDGVAQRTSGKLKTVFGNIGSSLLGALGGPWGLALGGATIALGLFADAQAKTQSEINSLSQALDQQTGQWNNAAKEMFTSQLLDQNANWWDDLARSGRRNMEELVRDTGMNMKEVTRILTDPSGRDAYIQNWEKIRDAAGDGKDVTDELAKSVGMTKDQLKGLSQTDLENMVNQLKKSADKASEAEQKVKALADATGVNSVQAAALAANYETLASATTSADDKFRALKGNLDILNGGTMNVTNAQKSLAQSLDDTKNKLASIAESAGGSIQGLYSVKDGFDFASQAGRDLHTALEGSADSILKIGTAALDQALKGGKSATDANSIAIQAMQPAIASLREQLANAGMLPPQIDAIVRSFGLMPDQVSTAISVEGTEEAQRKIFLTKLAADSFANNNYTGVLAALPDDAKAAIADATGTAEAFKNGDWSTVLKALDETGPGKEAALASILSVTNGNYEAALKALNLTGDPVANAYAQAKGYANADYTSSLKATNLAGEPSAQATAMANAFKTGDYTAALKAVDNTGKPVSDATGQALGFSRADFTAALKAADSTFGGRQAAVAAINSMTSQQYLAWIRAAADQGSINGVAGAFNALSAPRTMTITARYITSGSPVVGGGQVAAQIANGGIFGSSGIKTFADGGILNKIGNHALKSFARGGTENHVAQIAKGAWPVRVWAEPETGGEAYLPLHPSKRKRSLEILRQVMREFGLGQFIQFDSGGFMPKSNYSTPAVVSSRYSNTITPIGQTTSGSGAGAPNMTVIVNPSQRMDESQIGESAAKTLYWNYINRNK